MNKEMKIGIGVGFVILGFFILVFVAETMMIQEELNELRNMPIEELHDMVVSWQYDDLLRNPEKYKGKIIDFNGKIFMVDSVGKDHYRFVVWGTDQLIVDWKGGRLLPGDEIRGTGVFEGVIDVGSMLADDYYNPKPLVKGIHLTCTNC